MSTQELAQQILNVAHDMKAFAYDADLIDVSLNIIIQLCNEQLEVNDMGKPSKGTPADKRLKENKPVMPQPKPTPPKQPPMKKSGGK